MDRDTASVCGSGRIGELICDAISDTTIRCVYRFSVFEILEFGICGDAVSPVPLTAYYCMLTLWTRVVRWR